MNNDNEPSREWTATECAIASLALLLLTAPLATITGALALRWARANDHRPGMQRRVLATALAATVVTTLLTATLYAWAWRHWWHALTASSFDLILVPATLAMLPIAMPLGVAVAIGGWELWHHQAARHPLHGRAARLRRTERIRANRASMVNTTDVPLTASERPVLGAWLDGEHPATWTSGPWSVLPSDASHIVALGASGGGKTQSILRLAIAHLALGWQVIVIDGKEEPATAAEFARLATNHARRIRTWPGPHSLDLFRGEAGTQRDRWMAAMNWTEPYYRSVANSILTLAIDEPNGPPRSAPELLSRLDLAHLKATWAGTERAPLAAALTPSELQGIRHRAFALLNDLASLGAILNNTSTSSWSWEDSDAAWITLPTSTRPEAAAALGRALLVDAISYLRDPARRRTNRPVLLIIEELGALVSADPTTANLVIETVERGRSANVRCIVSAQTPEGLGDQSAQARLLHGGAAVLAHRMPNPEPIVKLLGTTLDFEASLGVADTGELGARGSLREQHQWRVPPDVLRQLPIGHALLAHAGQWALVAIARLKPEEPTKTPKAPHRPPTATSPRRLERN